MLAVHGAGAGEIGELLAYNDNVFEAPSIAASSFPLEDEPFVGAWDEYAAEAGADGVDAVLHRRFLQFSFPIERGISETESYRAAVRRGVPPANGLRTVLARPDLMRICVHPTSAGSIPLLITGDRRDFITCVQALTRRNEPVAIPRSMGACTVAGFNNWDRIRRLRHERVAEFERILPRKDLYQDRFIILSSGEYSDVPAADLGKEQDEWLAQSLILRREHECAHYFTRRVFGSMRNNVLDELIADYMGIVAIDGRFRAEWFLRFMGLYAETGARPDGRIHLYRGALSDGAFRVLQHLLSTAAQNIEAFQMHHREELAGQRGALAVLLLSKFTTEELASEEALRLLSAELNHPALAY